MTRFAARVRNTGLAGLGALLLATCSNRSSAPPVQQAPSIRVVRVTPSSGAIAARTATIEVQFGEAMDVGTLTAEQFLVSSPGGQLAGYRTFDPVTLTWTFSPSEPLQRGAPMRAMLGTGLRGVSGSRFATPFEWRFDVVDGSVGRVEDLGDSGFDAVHVAIQPQLAVVVDGARVVTRDAATSTATLPAVGLGITFRPDGTPIVPCLDAVGDLVLTTPAPQTWGVAARQPGVVNGFGVMLNHVSSNRSGDVLVGLLAALLFSQEQFFVLFPGNGAPSTMFAHVDSAPAVAILGDDGELLSSHFRGPSLRIPASATVVWSRPPGAGQVVPFEPTLTHTAIARHHERGWWGLRNLALGNDPPNWVLYHVADGVVVSAEPTAATSLSVMESLLGNRRGDVALLDTSPLAVQWLDPATGRFGPRLVSPGNGGQFLPVATLDDAGTLWHAFVDGRNLWLTRALRGLPFGAPILVWTADEDPDVRAIEVAGDASGRAIVAWQVATGLMSRRWTRFAVFE